MKKSALLVVELTKQITSYFVSQTIRIVTVKLFLLFNKH